MHHLVVFVTLFAVESYLIARQDDKVLLVAICLSLEVAKALVLHDIFVRVCIFKATESL